jgi:hypothetical protein
MKIGLVGEAPNDTQSIKNLLISKYADLDFFFMLQRINGASLDSQKTKRFLRIEYETQKPDIVIFIRDLDAILPNRKKLYERKDYFTSSNRVVDKKGIHLLHIYEIEALILADINTFNEIFKVDIKNVDNVMKISEPKEYLRERASDYNESKNPEIFEELVFDEVLSNCEYFSRFINNFDKILLELS